MRQRILFGVLGVTVVLSVLLTLYNRSAPHGSPPRTERRARQATARASAGPAAEVPPPRLRRNPFEYGGTRAAAAQTAPPPARMRATSTPEPIAETNVKLVGIVHRGEGRRAALNIEGTVTVLAAGESADGYTVVAIDEETGARLRTPDGREIVLAPSR